MWKGISPFFGCIMRNKKKLGAIAKHRINHLRNYYGHFGLQRNFHFQFKDIKLAYIEDISKRLRKYINHATLNFSFTPLHLFQNRKTYFAISHADTDSPPACISLN